LEKRAPWLLFVFALVLYAPSLANGLTTWDDPDYTMNSPFVKEGVSGAARAFTSAYHGAYIPLSHAVLAVTGAKDPANPLPYHLVQWLLFAIAVALMPKALSAFGVNTTIAFFATALWLAHPFRVESVSWVANVKDTISLVCLVGAMAAYASNRRWLSAVVFAVGLLGKASLAPLAPVFLLLEWRRTKPTAALVSSLRWLVPGLAAGVLAVLVHRLYLPTERLQWSWATPLSTPFWYLGRTLLPVGSRAVYDWSPASGPMLAAAIGGWVVTATVVTMGLRAKAPPLLRALAIGAVFFLLPLLPFTGVVPQLHVVAERYTLYPALVLAVGIATVLVAFGRVGFGILGALTLALAVPNVLRQREWKDALTLWTSNVALAPGSTIAHINLAGALGGVGRFEEAMKELQTVRALEPGYPGLDCFIAMARAGKERLDPSFAVTELGELCALKASERWPVAARIVARKDSSSVVVLEELAFGADRAKAAAAAGALALEKQQLDRALTFATQARLWDPSLDRAIVTQVIALVKLKRLDEARALTATPVKDARVAARLIGLKGVVLHEQGQFAEAEQLLRQSADQLKALGELPDR
jgi:tetratricopeptide (TPR) repeat protein